MQQNSGTFSYPPFSWFIGVVESIDDPEMIGRVKVRVFGFHSENKDEVKTEELPWATVMMPVTSASLSGKGCSPTGILNGTTVVGFFTDGEGHEMPVIMGTLPGRPTKESDDKKGFRDPSGVYPNYEDEEQDTNRLARGDKQDKTIIKKRNDSISKVNTVNGGNWEEPKSASKAKYPYNHVMETESGHIVEFDDTKDNERIMQYHKAGTFYEIDKNGSKVERIVKDNYQIILGSDRIYIKEDCLTTIDKSLKLFVSGNINVEVTGNYEMKVGGNYKLTVGGSQSSNTSGTEIRKSSSLHLN